MTDDIAAGLKEILNALEYGKPLYEVDWKRILGEAISRLTTPPLPEGDGEPCYYCGKPCSSIAGDPNEWPVALSHADDPGVTKWHHTGCVTERLRPAPPLPEEIAGLIEKTRKLATDSLCIIKYQSDIIKHHVERIRELEAERAVEKDKRLRAETHLADAVQAHEGSLQTERAAIRAKTIEDCAVLCDGFMDGKLSWNENAVLNSAANAIRDLAKTDEHLQKTKETM